MLTRDDYLLGPGTLWINGEKVCTSKNLKFTLVPPSSPGGESIFRIDTQEPTDEGCEVCWGSGFYKCYGAPCSRGCLPPKEDS